MGLVGLLNGLASRQKIDQEQYFLDYRQGEAATLAVTIVAQQLLEVGAAVRATPERDDSSPYVGDFFQCHRCCCAVDESA